MKIIILLLFSIGIYTHSNASFWYRDLEYLAMENFKVAKDKERMIIAFDYVINNPNWYNITLKPSVLKLTIAGSDCGEVMILDKINIKRKTKAAYAFVLLGDASKFIKSGFSSVFNMLSKGQIDFNLLGDLKAGVFGLTKKWKMDYTYKMTWSEFMSFF